MAKASMKLGTQPWVAAFQRQRWLLVSLACGLAHLVGAHLDEKMIY
jgi:hypothetical protein